jgi:hypothetical protein
MNRETTRIGICMLTLASLLAIGNGQETLLPDDADIKLADPSDKTLLNDVDEQFLPPAPAPTGRWIGVGVAPIPDVLKSHLNLAEGLGVMVDQVVPDSPAAQAGLRRFDVLISAGGVAVTDPEALINAVRGAKDGSLELKWIRGSQEMTAEVIPADRPKSLRLGESVPVDPQDIGRLRDWLGRLEQGRPGNQGRLRMRFMPQAPGAPKQSTFENSLQVQIERKNNEPAKIKVQKDGDTWELTEDDLDQLPPEIRGQVESMLGGGVQWNGGGLGGFQGLHGLDNLPEVQQLLEGMGGFRDFGNQFEQMNQQMERLFDEMRELRTQQRKLIPADQLQEGDEA